jgi:hypothetical protein
MELQDVAAIWPRWHTWAGVAGLLYASRDKTSPPAVLRAHTAAVLAARIRQWEHDRANGVPRTGEGGAQ